MIDICRYDESFSEEVKKLFRSLWEEIDSHGDVMDGTISVALEKGHPVGICFLMATSTYHSADREHPGYLNMEYQAVSDENEIEVCALLIDTLIADYRRICSEEPDKRIILPPRTLAYGDWTQQGFPFYSGKMTYRCPVSGGRRLRLRMGRFSAMPSPSRPRPAPFSSAVRETEQSYHRKTCKKTGNGVK